MNVGPVIVRELRAEAHNMLSYWLRALAPALVLFVCWLITQESRGNAPALGTQLFTGIHATLLVLICLIGPTLTADCLSRERREGTLGLLFLTPLTPWEIVVGKSFAHLLRAFTLWLAVLPVMTIPFLLGGITWSGVAQAVGMQFAFGLLGLAAGVLASACTRRAPCSLLLAVLLNAGFVGLLAVGLGSGFYTLGGVVLPAVIDEFDSFLAQAAIVSLLLLVRLLDAADWMTGVFPLGMAGWLQGVLIVEATALAGLIFLLAVACAALRLKRLRFEAPPSIEQLRLRASLFAPRFWSGRFRAARRRRLARNPVLWLQSYSPTARLARWGWCLVVVLYGCLLGSSGYPAEAFDDTYPLIQWLLLLGMASGAANSFRTERENGLLELLLVAPLTEGQIIAGRVRGLWSQHLPAVGMFLGLVGFVEWARVVNPPWYGPDPEATWWWFLPMLAALPVVGLFFALRLRVHSLAILSALFFGVVWPLSMPGMMAYAIKRAEFHLNLSLDGMVPGFLVAEDSSFWFFATLALVTGLCGYQLRRDLARRNFVAS